MEVVVTTTEEPIIRFVHQLLLDASRQRASDIHFESYETEFRIRFRQDGMLFEKMSLPLSNASRVLTRLKVMASMDISERRLPQDGRFKFNIDNHHAIDCRVSTCPTLFGEKIVVRLLDKKFTDLNIDALGMEAFQKDLLLKNLNKAQGLILITGPTGSGKTLTLYSALNYLNAPERNISSCEDPIEINLSGINQVNVNFKAGFNFATALKAFLRQDPDVIMIGEIRDPETAEMAIKAAETGHLVLASLHTSSASKTINRLLNMGIPKYHLASSLNLIIAQRLARKQYPEGSSGRIGIFEMLSISPHIENIIFRGGSHIEINQQAIHDGMWDLKRAAEHKVKQGIISLEEMRRVIAE